MYTADKLCGLDLVIIHTGSGIGSILSLEEAASIAADIHEILEAEAECVEFEVAANDAELTAAIANANTSELARVGEMLVLDAVADVDKHFAVEGPQPEIHCTRPRPLID